MIYLIPKDINEIIINLRINDIETEIKGLEQTIYDIDNHFKAHFKNNRIDLSNSVYNQYITNDSYSDVDIFNISENVIKKYTLLHPNIDYWNVDFIFNNLLFKECYHIFNGYFYKIKINDNKKYILVGNKKIYLSYEYSNEYAKYLYIYYDENRNIIIGEYDQDGYFTSGYFDINNNLITGRYDIDGNINNNLITTNSYDIDGNLIYEDEEDEEDEEDDEDDEDD